MNVAYVNTGTSGRCCAKFMASAIKDPHSTCIICCGMVFEIVLPCNICAAWDDTLWDQPERVKLSAAHNKVCQK